MAELVEFTVNQAHQHVDKDGKPHRYKKGESYLADPDISLIKQRVRFGHISPKGETPSTSVVNVKTGGQGGAKD